MSESTAGPDIPGPSACGDRRERVVLLTLVAMQFTSLDDFMLVTAMGPQLMESLAISPRQYSLLVSAYSFSAGIAGLIASTMVDRISRKLAFLGLYAGFVAGTLLCGLAPGYRTLLVALAITGALGGVLGGMTLAIIGDVFPEERRGAATGTLWTAYAISAVFGVPFGLFVASRFGWHAPFLLLAALGCPLLAAGIRFLPPLRGHLGQARASQPLREVWATYTHPNHVRAFALVMALWFSSYSVIPTILPYLKDNVGVPKANHPLVYLLGGSMTLIATPLVGRLADRHGKLRVYRMAAALSIAILLVLTNLPRVGLALAVGVVASFMVVNAARFVVAMALVNGSVEPPRRGSFLSANSSVQQMAMALGAAAGGWIVVRGTDGALRHFEIVGLISAGFTLLSLWLAGRLRRAASTSTSTAGSDAVAAAGLLGEADGLLPAPERA